MLSSLFGKKKKAEAPAIVADLDQIVAKPVGFRLGGKTHTINPISTKEFWTLSNALVELWALRDAKEVTPDELIDKYHGLVATVCPSIKRSDIEGMTQAQVAALYQLIMDAATGRAQAAQEASEAAQKKTLVS